MFSSPGGLTMGGSTCFGATSPNPSVSRGSAEERLYNDLKKTPSGFWDSLVWKFSGYGEETHPVLFEGVDVSDDELRWHCYEAAAKTGQSIDAIRQTSIQIMEKQLNEAKHKWIADYEARHQSGFSRDHQPSSAFGQQLAGSILAPQRALFSPQTPQPQNSASQPPNAFTTSVTLSGTNSSNLVATATPSGAQREQAGEVMSNDSVLVDDQILEPWMVEEYRLDKFRESKIPTAAPPKELC